MGPPATQFAKPFYCMNSVGLMRSQMITRAACVCWHETPHGFTQKLSGVGRVCVQYPMAAGSAAERAEAGSSGNRATKKRGTEVRMRNLSPARLLQHCPSRAAF